ncbi:Protein SMG [Parasponia andersonii]|uniref:Nonsense-mediated mRNA decay factor SMG8 n=1 Tax=Parasponia andersonii TaxID=3476 RepID=A0A2P5C2U3_PARAD|nr:Protein SMG [Parasponia andersonii]
MEASNPNPSSSSSVRVLTRPPSSTTLASSASSSTSQTPPPPPPIPTSEPSSSSSSDGVVVVGFIGRRPDITTHLLNRIVDANVFGSGNRDKSIRVEKEEVRDWFKWRRISYYHEERKGVLFLQFCSNLCPAFHGFSEPASGFDFAMEEHEFGDLQGMLFMFSEGSRFDTQLLKKFRVLQAAKHALAPFVRSQTMPGLPSRQQSSPSRSTASAPASNNSSPGRSRSILNRNGSAISLMSGLGSYTSLFPGQCTPVMLFVFIDDFSDFPNPSSNTEESTDTSSHSQPSLSSLTRSNLPAKVSSPVVVLARPMSKSEGGFRKKLQLSLEAQVRFLIKKCRTLSGSETSHAGSKSGGISSSAPLFSLDASRAVVLLDRSGNQRGESLEFATNLVEDVLNGKATSDSLLLESHGLSVNKDDIISIKDFIYRQSDILRGKGALIANSNTGSPASVGMVAVAAAAAAASASAASGKKINTLELPNIEVWLSSSQLILHGVLSANGGCLDEIEFGKRKPRVRNATPQSLEGIASKSIDPADVAVSWLESGKGLNTKFSTFWCERSLPAAKEVYLKDLPTCYPTSQHEAHLAKALQAFYSMVKGPATQNFAKKLEDECISIWKSGRQLCDAVSLTGKPCMHQRHDLQTDELVSGAGVKPHCSGYVFLHACACGRSRRLRLDPFDFESANITSNCFPDCDKLLPALQLPKIISAGPIQPSSWSLIRVGGARYHDPSKGLLQGGFSATQRFLLKWEIFLENQKIQNGLMATAVHQGSVIKSSTDPKLEPNVSTVISSTAAVQLHSGGIQSVVENNRRPSENTVLDDKKFSFGKGLPNFTMRKPFSEVVAGSAAGDSGFPPLQQRKQHSSRLDKSIRQTRTGDLSVEQTTDNQGSRKSEGTLSALDTSNGINNNGSTKADPYLHIGSNVVPVNRSSGEKVKRNLSVKRVTAYVGFEHECPHGHRFFLNPEHLNDLGTLYQLLEESQIPSSVENSDESPGTPSKLSNNGLRGKVHPTSNRMNATTPKKGRNMDTSKELVTDSYPNLDKQALFTVSKKEQNHISFGVSSVNDFVKDLQGSLDSIRIDDDGHAFSILNRNLPIYMNCPHCRLSKNNKGQSKVKFAGTISQLQRIFVVTPSFPVVLATCPLIQFEASSLPPSIPERDQKLQFSLGCEVLLPPESFLTLRLPFVYGVELEDGSLHSLKYFEHQPEATAWITKGTTLQIVCKRNSVGHYGSHT